MPVKKSRLGLLNPVTSAKEKYLSSQRGSAELIRAMTGGGEFSNTDHIWTLEEEIHERKNDLAVADKTKLKGLVRDLTGTDMRLILRAKITCVWMSVCGTKVSGTLLSAMEFWDFLCARYNVSPLNLRSQYDGCSTTHSLSCSTGRLVIARHN